MLAGWMLFPCAATAQGGAPSWVDSEVRSALYPAETHYTGFAQLPVASSDGAEKALNRAKQAALTELSERVRVLVDSRKTSVDVSVGGSDIEEEIRSQFISTVRTTSQTEVVGSNLKTHYDRLEGEAYALAFVSKAELASYYRKQIALHLNKVDGALQTADELAQKGYKARARRQCEGVVSAFAKVAYAQDLLTAIDDAADDNTLQQSRSEQLRNTLVQTITDLENSIFVYVECHETVEDEEVVYIADKLPQLLTEGDCGCSFTESKEDADYVVKVSAYLARCTDATGGSVFCYADATVSLYNARTQKTLKPKIGEAKGGWTGRNYTKAGEEAFDNLAKKIAEKVAPMMKN
jgi:phosphoglycolate phosphatase-like HAD superfamily hydrolase